MKYKFFHAFYLSFFSKPLYRSVGRDWKGISLVYLFLLQAICSLALVARLSFDFSSFVDKDVPAVVEQIPAMTISNGIAATEEAKPYFIRIPDEQDKLLAVIDTTGQYTSLEEAKAPILITQNEAILEQRNQVETRTYSFQEISFFELNREIINNFLKACKEWFAIVLYPIAFVWYYPYRIVQALIYAIVGLIFARFANARPSFAALMRLSVVAMTPVLLVEAAFRSLGIPFLPSWGFLGLFLVLCLLFYGVKANANNPEPDTSELELN